MVVHDIVPNTVAYEHELVTAGQARRPTAIRFFFSSVTARGIRIIIHCFFTVVLIFRTREQVLHAINGKALPKDDALSMTKVLGLLRAARAFDGGKMALTLHPGSMDLTLESHTPDVTARSPTP